MKVEIWSDVVCPFCYIGKRKFEKALEDFQDKQNVEIEWRSFQLDPGMQYVEGQSVHAYLGKRKGGTEADGKRMNDQMAAIAKEVGLEFNFDKAIVNNTMDAHRLLHFARQHELQNELKERLFKAYYTEGKNIGDKVVLESLAVETGLPVKEVKEMLEGNRYMQEVKDDQDLAGSMGINGVPFFVFNNKYAVSGAQPTEVFSRALTQAFEEEEAPPSVTEEGTGFCNTEDGTCN